jgi:glucose/arabinose dehydrogenase
MAHPSPLHFGLAFFVSSSLLCVAAGDIVTSEKQTFRVETIVEGLDHPWGVVNIDTDRFLITERKGSLRLLEKGTLHAEPIRGVPSVFAKGQGGLLDIQLHPDFATNGWIYLAFSKPIGDGALTSIVRARLKDHALVDLQTVFDPPAEEASGAGVHFGCRITFDGKGHFFFSIGDRGGPTNPTNSAQRTDTVRGKIHRLNDDGSVPPDNPFANTPGAKPSIWCFGNRNPQGLAFDAATDRLWETEHGPRGGDELNLIKKGLNYGWPLVTFGINYSGKPITNDTALPGFESPVVNWTPSIAASGLAVYHGDAFPQWKNNLFSGALIHRKLVRIELDAAGAATYQELLLERTGRIRDVRVFVDGYLYVLYDEPGKLIRLIPVAN